MLSPAIMMPWQFLGDWTQGTKERPFEAANGKTFWEYMDHDPEFKTLFHGAMESDSRMMNLCHSNEGQLTEAKLFFDMLMMVAVNGRERTEQDWQNLFMAAAFTHYKIYPLFGMRPLNLIEVYP
ncbi:putative Flavonoid o-methyltransferase related [Hibiscus syriacus]|uniref:Flavonoid o-methyltransferase related n=1 Tax=Hibiscus syriacus TaxID=106335 RepID=A0A6A2YBE7_HIBSY|nr:putative Flavonoid o-methyltransferase related [Hibiscus syriacus]